MAEPGEWVGAVVSLLLESPFFVAVTIAYTTYRLLPAWAQPLGYAGAIVAAAATVVFLYLLFTQRVRVPKNKGAIKDSEATD